jgi:hypothetical protein
MGQWYRYDHSVVTGTKLDEKGHMKYIKKDDFVHLRHQDPILMACRRSRNMASCDHFDVETKHMADRWVDDCVVHFVSSRAAAVPEYEW